MKNFMKFGLVMAMLLGMAFSAFANTTDFSLRLKNGVGKTIRFSIQEARNVTLTIYGENDDLLYQEVIKSDGHISRNYDLTQFPEGNYTLEANAGATITRYAIVIDADSARFGEEPKAEVKKPVLVNKGNGRVTISIINADQTPVEITILDESGSEIYTDIFPAAVSTIKMFNFANVGYGDYTFVTKYGNKTFTESVRAGY